MRKGRIFSGVVISIISFGLLEGTFKQDLSEKWEFSLGVESHQQRQNSVLWWQHKEEGEKQLGSPEG